MNITRLIGIVSVLLASRWALAGEPPQIITQPTNTTVSLGATAKFTVTAKATPPATLAYYHWWYEEAPLDTNANRSASTRVLSLTNVTTAQAGPYFVVVTDSAGLSINSDEAVLDVDPTFTKITTGPPVKDLGSSGFVVSRDYNKDGFDDLLVIRAPLGKSTLYRNNGDGTFTTVPYLPPWGDSTTWIPVFGWSDLDSDGQLDLLYGPYLNLCRAYFNRGDGWSPPIRLASSANGVSGIVDFDQDGLLDVCESLIQGIGTARLYWNAGNRTFLPMSSNDVGPLLDFAHYGGVSWADYDDDGWIDVCVPDSPFSSKAGKLYRNEGGGWFVENTSQTFRLHLYGHWGDYDNDGRVDLCGPLWHDPPNWNAPAACSLYRNLGGGQFEERFLDDTNLGPHSVGSWADYDNDGFLDLFLSWVVVPNDTPPGWSSLYHNNGDGTFSRITRGSIVTDLPVGGAGSGASLWFDYDNDGFLDLYVANADDWGSFWTANFLYRNNGNANAWLKVKLIGTASNRDAIGAKVRVQATFAGQVRWQRRDISAGDMFSGNNPHAHFGLGDATIVDLVRVEWPSGLVQELTNVPVKQTLTITEHQAGVTHPPTLTATRSPEGAVQLTLTGEKNFLYVFEASTDLAKWMKLGVRTNLTGTVEFTDTFAANDPHRFYRGVAP